MIAALREEGKVTVQTLAETGRAPRHTFQKIPSLTIEHETSGIPGRCFTFLFRRAERNDLKHKKGLYFSALAAEFREPVGWLGHNGLYHNFSKCAQRQTT